MKKIIKILLPVLLTMVIISACDLVPFTGRSQTALIPEGQLVELSTQNYQDLLKNSKLSQDTEKINMMRKVATRLTGAVESFKEQYNLKDELKYYKWEFNLLQDDKMINAFCLPGGKVAVYTGILPVTMDDNGLAVVLGHEIAHAVARHGNERMSQQLMLQFGSIVLSEAIKDKPEQTRQIFTTVYGVGTELGLVLPYGRTHETEADRIGLILMTRAGYNPESAVAFWERMKKQGGPNPPEFLSTHPAHERRIEDIKKFIPETMKYYTPANS